VTADPPDPFDDLATLEADVDAWWQDTWDALPPALRRAIEADVVRMIAVADRRSGRLRPRSWPPWSDEPPL
jgi:hypothetical protein